MTDEGVQTEPDGVETAPDRAFHWNRSMLPAQALTAAGTWQAGALAGIVFVAFSASAEIAVPQMPPAGTAPAAVLTYVETNQRVLEWTWFLAGEVAWLFGLCFCATLAVALWSSSPNRVAAVAGLSGAVVTAALTISAGIAWGLLIYLGPHLASGDLVLALAESRHFADSALSIPTAAMLLGFSLSAVGAPGIAYRVLAAGGLVAAVFQLVHVADDFLTYGQTGFLPRLAAEAALAWILAASGVLLIRGPHHRAAGRRFAHGSHLLARQAR
jgi:hypothetical protein